MSKAIKKIKRANSKAAQQDEPSKICPQHIYRPIFKPYKMVSLGSYIAIKEKIRYNGKSLKVIYSQPRDPRTEKPYYRDSGFVPEQYLALNPAKRLIWYLQKQKFIKNLDLELHNQSQDDLGDFPFCGNCFSLLRKYKGVESLKLSFCVNQSYNKFEEMNQKSFDNLIYFLQNCKLKSFSLTLINSDHVDNIKLRHAFDDFQHFVGFQQSKQKLFKIIAEQKELKLLDLEIGLDQAEIEQCLLPCIQNSPSLESLKIRCAQIKPSGNQDEKYNWSWDTGKINFALEKVSKYKNMRSCMKVLFNGIETVQNINSLSIDFTSVPGSIGWYKYHSGSVIEDLGLLLEKLKDKLTTLDIKFEKFKAMPMVEGEEVQSEFIQFSKSLATLKKLKSLGLDFSCRKLLTNEEESLIGNGLSSLLNIEELNLAFGQSLFCSVADDDDYYVALQTNFHSAIQKLTKLHSLSFKVIVEGGINSYKPKTRKKLTTALKSLKRLKNVSLAIHVDQSKIRGRDVRLAADCILNLKKYLTSFALMKTSDYLPDSLDTSDMESLNTALETLQNLGKLRQLDCNLAFPSNLRYDYGDDEEKEAVLYNLQLLINRINGRQIFNLEDTNLFDYYDSKEGGKMVGLDVPAIENIKYQKMRGARIQSDGFKNLSSK